jgi:dihydrofolate synthase / folylpolyglutamate synthase
LRRGIATDYTDAVAYLDAHIGLGVKPGLERITALMEVMGDPHRSVPVIHVTGTNGKTSTVRMIDAILGEHGLAVGRFISPHLQAVEERIAIRGAAQTREEFAATVGDVAPFADISAARGEEPTYFELSAALAFAAFEAAAVDVAAVEVGLGGRWDATNVVDANVSVITSIGEDHVEYLGATPAAIAAEKVAILKDGGILVTAPLPAAAEGPITARVAETGSRWFRAGADFAVESSAQAVGGWLCDFSGIHDTYPEVFLGLLGAHQVANFATAIASCEAFFGRALDHDAVRQAATEVTTPGRLEILQRRPLVLLDGAHNLQGMEALAVSLETEFPPDTRWTLLTGFRGARDAAALLAPLRTKVHRVLAAAARDGQAQPAGRVATAAGEALGVPVETAPSVAEGLAAAIAYAGPGGAVLVTGSLYVVGEARSHHAAGSARDRIALAYDPGIVAEAVDDPESEDEEWPENWDDFDDAD